MSAIAFPPPLKSMERKRSTSITEKIAMRVGRSNSFSMIKMIARGSKSNNRSKSFPSVSSDGSDIGFQGADSARPLRSCLKTSDETAVNTSGKPSRNRKVRFEKRRHKIPRTYVLDNQTKSLGWWTADALQRRAEADTNIVMTREAAQAYLDHCYESFLSLRDELCEHPPDEVPSVGINRTMRDSSPPRRGKEVESASTVTTSTASDNSTPAPVYDYLTLCCIELNAYVDEDMNNGLRRGYRGLECSAGRQVLDRYQRTVELRRALLGAQGQFKASSKRAAVAEGTLANISLQHSRADRHWAYVLAAGDEQEAKHAHEEAEQP